jgi:glucose-6-phosphate 1-dehydrogenase
LKNLPPVHTYKPGTWGPEEAEKLVAADGGWLNPN